MNCDACQTELIATQVEVEQLVRCGSCGHRFMPRLVDAEATRKTDEMAKRSFWLGLSSILLFAITGIPALIYGVRSLTRMRFRVARKREKFHAIVGTVLGVLFGCIGSLMVLVMGSMVAIVFFTLEESRDPIRVAEAAETVVSFDDVEGLELEPQRLFTLVSQKSLEFADAADRSDQSLRLRLVELHLQPNNSQAKSMSQSIAESSDFQKISSIDLPDWEVAGKALVVRNTYEKKDAPDIKRVSYSCYYQKDMSWLVVSLLLKRPDSKVEEAQVRQLFESIKPAIHEK